MRLPPPVELRILNVHRSDIEQGITSPFLTNLLNLLDTRESVLRWNNSVKFAIDGYDDDPRPLDQIMEVRAFFQMVNMAWPHWMWFMTKHNQIIPRLMHLLTPIRYEEQDGKCHIRFTDMAHLTRVINDMRTRAESLFQMYPDIEPELQAVSLKTGYDDIFDPCAHKRYK